MSSWESDRSRRRRWAWPRVPRESSEEREMRVFAESNRRARGRSERYASLAARVQSIMPECCNGATARARKERGRSWQLEEEKWRVQASSEEAGRLFFLRARLVCRQAEFRRRREQRVAPTQAETSPEENSFEPSHRAQIPRAEPVDSRMAGRESMITNGNKKKSKSVTDEVRNPRVKVPPPPRQILLPNTSTRMSPRSSSEPSESSM